MDGYLVRYDLRKSVLTDLKPPVFHRIMQKMGEQINKRVLKEIHADISPIKSNEFKEQINAYANGAYRDSIEAKILRAAHYLATQWEFNIIYNTCPYLYGIEKTKEEIESQIEEHSELVGVQKIIMKRKAYGFIDLCGQLRFQKRWAQTPRVPHTFVLGHMLIVAILSYISTLEFEEKHRLYRRIYNNFFCGLFHDLPEVLTKDIISPIKKKVEGLDDIIKEYENIQLEERILPLLPTGWHDEMRFFMKDEFKDRHFFQGEPRFVKPEEFEALENEILLNPIDGSLILIMDNLAAFFEASLSIEYGISTRELMEGRKTIYDKYKDCERLGHDYGQYFNYFDEIKIK